MHRASLAIPSLLAAQSHDLFTKRANLDGDVRAIIPLWGADEPAGEKGRKRAEEPDARTHQDRADEAALRRHREAISVSDGGDRRECPPDGVFSSLDI